MLGEQMTLRVSLAVLMVLGLTTGCRSPRVVRQDALLELPQDASLRLGCIDGLDERTAWVGGSFVTGGGIDHSVMYVTHDAGKTWQQRGPKIVSSGMFDIFFLDKTTGWAVGAWTTESTGDPFVLRTRDCGITWIRSEIPMQGLFDPMDIVFSSTQDGIMRGSRCGPSLDEVLWFSTKDGGKSWRFARGQGAPSIGGKGDGFTLSVTRNRFMWRLSHPSMPDGNCVSVSSDDGMTWTRTEGQAATSEHNN
jgi:hypothetical protein